MEAKKILRAIVSEATVGDDSVSDGLNQGVFMARYDFVLTDEILDATVPITIYTEKPLDFELPEGTAPTDQQLEKLIEGACSGSLGTPEVTDAFEVLLDLLYDYMREGVGEWDDDSAHRIGRLFGIASFFDAGVNIWLEQWASIGQHALDFAGFDDLSNEALPTELADEIGRGGGAAMEIVANEVAGEILAARVADKTFARLKKEFGDPTLKLLKRIDMNTGAGVKSKLSFEELRQFVSVNEHDLRRFLVEMLDSGHYPKEWKFGRRWKLPEKEKSRISDEFWDWFSRDSSEEKDGQTDN